MPDGKPVTTKRLRKLLEEQQYQCLFTGRRLTPETASVDHMTPVSRDGPNTMENICIVHSEINRAKGMLTVPEFIELCREVIEWADRYELDSNGQIS